MEEVGYKTQLRIARDTLKMNPAIIGVMGGMILAEAEAFIAAHEARQKARRNRAARERHSALTSLGLKRTPYGYE